METKENGLQDMKKEDIDYHLEQAVKSHENVYLREARRYELRLRFIKESRLNVEFFINFMCDRNDAVTVVYYYNYHTKELLPFLCCYTEWFYFEDAKLQGYFNCFPDILEAYHQNKMSAEEYYGRNWG